MCSGGEKRDGKLRNESDSLTTIVDNKNSSLQDSFPSPSFSRHINLSDIKNLWSNNSSSHRITHLSPPPQDDMMLTPHAPQSEMNSEVAKNYSPTLHSLLINFSLIFKMLITISCFYSPGPDNKHNSDIDERDGKEEETETFANNNISWWIMKIPIISNYASWNNNNTTDDDNDAVVVVWKMRGKIFNIFFLLFCLTFTPFPKIFHMVSCHPTYDYERVFLILEFSRWSALLLFWGILRL